MVRSVKNKYGAWIATYYDDFTGARAIPNDDNTPSATDSYDKNKTHYGNPMNGEAPLNPRFRWSNNEINKGNNYDTALIGTDDSTKELSNSGAFEWLSLDTIRQKNNEYEGRSQIQYPDGNVGNKWKFDGSGSDSYLLFCNGKDTLGRYVVPLGDDDATFGRATMNNYTVSNYETSKNAGIHTQTSGFVQRAHLAGVWLGETTEYDHKDPGGTPVTESPRNVFQPVKSPSGQPFLVVQSFHATDSSKPATTPSIAYDGSLNSIGDGDIFTVRFAVRSYSGKTTNEGKLTPVAEVKFGYTGAPLSTLYQAGLTGSAAIQWTVDLSSYNTHPFKYSTDTNEISEVTHWIDLDFVLDYTNGKFKVYQDGTEITATNTLGGAYSSGYSFTGTAANMYGWEMEVRPDTGQTNTNCVLMLERAAVYRPLSDHPDDRTLAPMTSMRMASSVNGISSMELEIQDDPASGASSIGDESGDYTHNLISFFNNSNTDDIFLLLFTNPTRGFASESHSIDRPSWMGVIERMDIKQDIKERTLFLRARDMLSVLDRQVPLWEVGQKGLNENESSTPYWLYDAQGMRNIMKLGATPLKFLDSNVGFDVDDNYKELKNQRMQLNSSHPIQIYNNEDATYGPNNIETQYEGAGIIGFGKFSSGGTDYTTILFRGNPGYSGGDTFNVRGSANHNTTSAVTVNATHSGVDSNGNQYVRVTPDISSPSAARIIYAGNQLFQRYSGDIPAANSSDLGTIIARAWFDSIIATYPKDDDPTVDHAVFVFDANPNLQEGQSFYVFEENEDGNTSSKMQDISGFHKTKSVTRIWNYFDDTMDTSTYPYLYVVDTHTPYSDIGSSDFGNYYSIVTGYENVNLTTNRASYSNDSGVSTNIPSANDKGLDHKAVHAVWMRDLPQSLWFQYHFGEILYSPSESADLGASVSPNATTVRASFTAAQFSAIPTAGVAEIEDRGRLDRNKTRDKFIYRGKVESGGNYYLVGCSYISNTHATTYNEVGVSLTTKVHICNINNDYKHLYVLWSDMRNNGKANADGGYRKKDFGLLYPAEDNYEISLFYTDQDVDADGMLDRFTDLKIGEDVDVWMVDSTNDPSTSGAFSKPADYSNSVAVTSLANSSGSLLINTANTGSVSAGDYVHIVNSTKHDGAHLVDSVVANTSITTTTTYSNNGTGTGGAFYCESTGSETDLTQYQDWEDKGGAFVIIDSSKFFNINSLANGGKTGQHGGGKTTLGDYIATIKGYPTLIDNYWAKMISHASNTESPYGEHPNSQYIVNELTEINEDITEGDFFIKIDDAEYFSKDGGFGRITGVKNGGSTGQSITELFLLWSSVNDTVRTGTLTGKSADTSTGVYTLTDSSATFKTWGIKAGMLIENTTTALNHVDTAGFKIRRYFRIESVTSETEITVKIVFTNRSDSRVFSAFTRYNEANTATLNSFQGEEVFWAISHGYSIPIQLANCFATAAPSEPFESISEHFDYVLDELAYGVMWDDTVIPYITTSITQSNYDSIFVSSALTPAYNNRLMMCLKGFVRSNNNGAFWDSDKFRLLWNAALMQTWFPKTRLTAMFDINNIPITTNMTTYNDKTSNDSYGSIVDSRGKTLWATVKKIQEASGVGDTNGLNTTFSYLCGRDGRIEYRPKYNSGHDLSRDNIMISDLTTDVAGKISHVRVYYRNGQSFIDYPEAALTDTTKWKTIQHPEVINDLEALSLAKKAYNSLKESRLSVKVKPIRDATTDDKMLSNGRFGYIADPYRTIQGYNNEAAGGSSWTSLAAGGAPFCGMINALDGNMRTSTDIYNRYGEGGIIDSSSSTIDYNENYYFYGANSLSYAVQVVHVPAKCPLESGTTGEELRVAVHLSGGSTIDDAQFTIGLYDYSFSTSSSARGGGAPTLTASLAANGSETVDAVQSGFYEIKVPDSYDSNNDLNDGSIVISFNADYCRALLRHRCGDPEGSNILKNAHDITGLSSFGAPYNTDSIFPLGMRKYTEMSSFADERAEWYAPRIHVVNDYTFIPATFVKLTDAGIGLNDETMVIQKIDWRVNNREVEDLEITLERDESLSAGNIMSYLFPQYSTGGINKGGGEEPAGDPHNNVEGGESGGSDYSPPHDRVGQDSDPNDKNPVGGGSVVSGRTGGAGSVFTSKITSNRMSAATHSMIRGRMALDADQFTPHGEFSILGQKKPTPTPASMRSGSNSMSYFSPSQGAAAKTNNGFSLPPSNFFVESSEQSDSDSAIAGEIVVPDDTTSDEVSITAQITHGPFSNFTTKSVLYVEVYCEESGTTTRNKLTFKSGMDRKVVEILPKQSLNGAGKGGNRLTIKIHRQHGEGSDNSNQSIVINDLRVNFKRSAFPTSSQGKQFSQFS